MKTAKEWIAYISKSGEGHKCNCICDRCKNGQETFLLESDIREIQADALWHAAKSVHDILRGTQSEEHATTIGEARDLIAKMVEPATHQVSDQQHKPE